MSRTNFWLLVIASAVLCGETANSQQVEFSRLWSYSCGDTCFGVGHGLTAGGDPTSDGANECLVQHINGQDSTSMVHIVDSRSFRALLTVSHPDLDFGRSSKLVDVNGDLSPDLVVSSPNASDSRGRVWILDGVSTEVLRSFEGEEVGATFGRVIEVFDDIDSDGWRDLLVGSPGYDAGELNSGRLYLISSRTGNILWTQDGQSRAELFPSNITVIEDVDGDGVSEFGISSSGASPSGVRRAGHVWLRSGLVQSLIWEIVGTRAESGLGVGLSGISDMDGDGVSELGYSVTLDGYYIVSGSDGSERFWFAYNDDRFGGEVVGIDDVNDDDVDDFLMADIRDGMARVLSGANSETLSVITGGERNRFPNELASPGDITGDGLADFVASQPYAMGVIDRVVYFQANCLHYSRDASNPLLGNLTIRAPALANQTVYFMVSLSADAGFWLGNRLIPLDMDPLLRWSLEQKMFCRLDASGKGHVSFPRSWNFPDELYIAFVAPNFGRSELVAVSNSEKMW